MCVLCEVDQKGVTGPASLNLHNLKWGSSQQVLYHFIQFERHTSHSIFIDPANNFFSIYGDFGDLLEK